MDMTQKFSHRAHIGQVATPLARNPHLTLWLLHLLAQQDLTTRPGSHSGSHHPCGTTANHYHIEMSHSRKILHKDKKFSVFLFVSSKFE